MTADETREARQWRGLSLSLFWRVILANVLIYAVSDPLAAALFPGELHQDVRGSQLAELLVSVLLVLIANVYLLRRWLRPLERLSARMDTTDVLRGAQRVPITGVGEIARLEHAFNAMIERLEQERRQAGAAAIKAQEDERLRLAQGLHDEVGQSMTAVLLSINELAATARPEDQALLTRAQRVVNQSVADVRRLAEELRPDLLDNLGLTSALTHLARTIEQSGHVHVRRRLERGLPPLDPQVELVLYRVAQESLTNVLRHAEASEATLSLARNNGSIVLQVIDNGRGLDPAAPEGGGLRGIRERAQAIGGAAAIKPGPAGGVEVRLEIPTAGA